jgi:hypothetical protein
MRDQKPDKMTVKEMVQNIGIKRWLWNYYDFCALLKLERGSKHAEMKWNQFQDLSRSIAEFDTTNLEILFSPLEQTQ